jgi:hypothetical protein
MSFGAKGFSPTALGEETVFVSGPGTTAEKGEPFAPVTAIAPPSRTANLLAMPLRNSFLSFCI